jgi:SHS2 domain-containing protein
MSYRWHDGTGEFALDLEGASREDVFAEAVAAIRNLVGGDDMGGPPVTRTITLTAATDAELLALWLEELVFLVATESFVPESGEVTLTGSDLDGTVNGHRGTPRRLVKAVTYHQLAFAHHDAVWQAHVVLDKTLGVR